MKSILSSENLLKCFRFVTSVMYSYKNTAPIKIMYVCKRLSKVLF